MRPITASDLMNPDVITVRDDLTVQELAAFLTENEITGAPVEDEDGSVVGVVSVVDIARAEAEKVDPTSWYFQDTPPGTTAWSEAMEDGIRLVSLREDTVEVRDLMNTTLHYVSPVDTVREVARKMLDYHLHRVLVVDQGRLVGLISTSDLLGLFLEGDEEAQTYASDSQWVGVNPS